MKLLTYSSGGIERVGLLDGDGETILPLRDVVSMQALIESGESFAGIANLASPRAEGVRLADVEKRAPIPHPRQDIICLGVNYMSHAEEAARIDNEKFDGQRPHAVYFGKRAFRASADGDPIPAYDDLVENTLDYEVELTAIIGKDAKKVSRERALDHVFGYTIMNDVSARNIQRRHKQFLFGKSFDGFAPMGPWIVTADEFGGKEPILRLTTRVNGELRQDSSTDRLLFNVSYIISELSQAIELKAGSIIATGTPSGVGIGFKPPKCLRRGDVVECEIARIGVLRNAVV